MARPNNRVTVLDAAVRVIEDHGVAALTLEAVATESRLTKAGVMYHFGSMAALLTAVHEHLGSAWEAEMVQALGKSPEEATEAERVAAYVEVTARSATRTEIVLKTEAAQHDNLSDFWIRIADRWSPRIPQRHADGSYDDAVVRTLMAKLAADGLWAYESSSGQNLPEGLRAELIERILTLIEPAPK